MKKLFYTVALVVMGITASYAQKPEREKLTPEQRAEKTATALEQKLSLNADQKTKVQQLELERIKKNDEWRKQDVGTMKDKMEERKAYMKASKEKMDAILTPEQKKTLDASRDKMRDKMKDRKGGKGLRGPKGTKPGEGTPTPPAKNN
ncbi:multiple ligand-binding protein 1 [Pedobacter polaris]|uniref:Multiple ligand-binding protein 1 n=1 Tax=Pedobacter polaris TaxID=2571273 RepID=A0A4V5NZW6_9SPHI|nr:multiple ligand-binding protein 1 [Pedobacter polaris]TKC10252.1 multiple ligand-binding protein 1 [Pedobacter polaris]